MGSRLYDRIGNEYDVTRRADPYLTTRMAHLLGLRQLGRYLDVGCGTGSYTLALAARGGLWTGVDHAITMIEQARAKSDRVCWKLGSAEGIPAADATLDGALCSLALHHFRDLDVAFRELRRVIADGPFVMFTSTPEQMRGYWLNVYFPVAMARSIAQMPELDAVEAACLRAGFSRVDHERYFVQPDLRDGFLFYGKHRPDVYLSEERRAGISTFRVLADADEIRTGCEHLAEDLRSGRFANVLACHESELGDYVFITAKT